MKDFNFADVVIENIPYKRQVSQSKSYKPKVLINKTKKMSTIRFSSNSYRDVVHAAMESVWDYNSKPSDIPIGNTIWIVPSRKAFYPEHMPAFAVRAKVKSVEYDNFIKWPSQLLEESNYGELKIHITLEEVVCISMDTKVPEFRAVLDCKSNQSGINYMD